jgi:hypothetical protein
MLSPRGGGRAYVGGLTSGCAPTLGHLVLKVCLLIFVVLLLSPNVCAYRVIRDATT